MDGRRRRHPPLTPARQSLALSAGEWIPGLVRSLPRWFRRLHGDDELTAEAWYAATVAAAVFDPVSHPGVPFEAFARRGVRLHLRAVAERTHGPTWRQWPEGSPSCGSLAPTDGRRGTVHPALREWCDEDARGQRRCLDWRSRVLLYLRAVEGLTFAEIGEAVGVSKQRAEWLIDRAADQLADYRLVCRVRRQVAGQVTTTGGY